MAIGEAKEKTTTEKQQSFRETLWDIANKLGGSVVILGIQTCLPLADLPQVRPQGDTLLVT